MGINDKHVLDTIDETIETISESIIKNIENFNGLEEISSMPEMIKALAELISARAVC